MEFQIINYDYNKIIVNNSTDKSKFRNDISRFNNIIYLFFRDSNCLYIGQTKNTLHDRCYKNSPKHCEQDWFKIANLICIIKLDDCVTDRKRRLIESSFIFSYNPLHNKM